MAEILTNYWGKIRCWVCLGAGWVQGPVYRQPCPNDHCPHRPKR